MGDVIEKLTGGASIAPDDYVDVGYRTIPKGAVNSSGVADMSGCKNVSEIFFKKNITIRPFGIICGQYDIHLEWSAWCKRLYARVFIGF